MEKEFDLGMTEEEFDRSAEDLAAEIDDFDLVENKITYEVWILGYDSEMNATDFEYFIDGDYTEVEEAQKCFDYFTDLDNIGELMQKIDVPDDTKHLHLFLEECMNVDDGEGGQTTECQDIIAEVEIY